MLTLKETAALLEILQTVQTLEAAALAFQRAFVRAEHFRVAAAVCVLIEDGLLPAAQRATALYIIYDLYRNDGPGVHPFMPFLVALLHDPASFDLQQHERNLLCQLLNQAPGDAAPARKKTPAELEAMWPAGGEQLPAPNLAGLRQTYAERDLQVPAARKMGVSPLVADPLQPFDVAGGAAVGAAAAAVGAAAAAAATTTAGAATTVHVHVRPHVVHRIAAHRGDRSARIRTQS